jgi:hypothetical protein
MRLFAAQADRYALSNIAVGADAFLDRGQY